MFIILSRDIRGQSRHQNIKNNQGKNESCFEFYSLSTSLSCYRINACQDYVDHHQNERNKYKDPTLKISPFQNLILLGLKNKIISIILQKKTLKDPILNVSNPIIQVESL